MKLPGKAWLKFEVEGTETKSTVKQMAVFDTVGLPGILYWYLVFPLHSMVFKGMLRNIVKEAEKLD